MQNLIYNIFVEICNKYKDCIAFINGNTGCRISFNDLKIQTYKIAKLLQDQNIKNQNIILYMKPQAYCHSINWAVMLSQNISVPCSFTYNVSDIEYIVELTSSNIIFTDNIDLIKKYSNEAFSRKKIYYTGINEDISVYNNENLKIYNLTECLKDVQNEEYIKQEEINSEDTASIFFSSGTTGNPKGIVLTHKNIVSSFLSYCKALNYKEKGNCITIFSPSHVAPILNDWSVLYWGNTVIYTDYIKFNKTLKKYEAKYLICVPKLLIMEKNEYYKKLQLKSEKFKFYHDLFYKLSLKYIDLGNNTEFKLFDKLKLILYKLINTMGIKCFFSKILDEINIKKDTVIVGFGAYIDTNIEKFYNAIGIKFLVHYGLTEAAGCLSYITKKREKFGSVGKVNSDLSVIISDIETGEQLPAYKTGLIKAKGPQIMKEYYKNEAETQSVFDKDGYLITGDIGYLSKDNYLFFKGRYKNIIVLNNGENINPEELEVLCKNSKYVKQINILGQDKPYLTAIVVPNIDLKKENNINDIKQKVLIDINNVMSTSPYFKWIHQIKDMHFAPEEFTQENGLLTKKYTLNRNAIYNKYKNIIEEMYNNEK